jgi:hypothetical protein
VDGQYELDRQIKQRTEPSDTSSRVTYLRQCQTPARSSRIASNSARVRKDELPDPGLAATANPWPRGLLPARRGLELLVVVRLDYCRRPAYSRWFEESNGEAKWGLGGVCCCGAVRAFARPGITACLDVLAGARARRLLRPNRETCACGGRVDSGGLRPTRHVSYCDVRCVGDTKQC